MRIAVTTIALNEQKHVRRWAESAADADLLMIADTGSTDGTVAEAMLNDVLVYEISVSPWRFDTARNVGLALLPSDIDIVVTLDMDEVLTPGWRESLEAAPTADQYLYDYVWNWTENGEPNISFHGNKCHRRFGYMWKHPVHETLVRVDGKEPVSVHAGFGIHHHSDDSKPRSQYLPLLEQAVMESPEDDRIAHYYARELFFTGDWDRARVEFIRHLRLPSAVWPAERAQSYRYLAKMDDYPERWLLKAVAEDPSRREAWVDLVRFYSSHGLRREAAGVAARALSIDGRKFDYMTEAAAWDDEYVTSLVVDA